MKRWLRWVQMVLPVLGLLAAYLLLWPVPIEARTWAAQPSPARAMPARLP